MGRATLDILVRVTTDNQLVEPIATFAKETTITDSDLDQGEKLVSVKELMTTNIDTYLKVMREIS